MSAELDAHPTGIAAAIVTTPTLRITAPQIAYSTTLNFSLKCARWLVRYHQLNSRQRALKGSLKAAFY
jgi:hypothetical protein